MCVCVCSLGYWLVRKANGDLWGPKHIGPLALVKKLCIADSTNPPIECRHGPGDCLTSIHRFLSHCLQHQQKKPRSSTFRPDTLRTRPYPHPALSLYISYCVWGVVDLGLDQYPSLFLFVLFVDAWSLKYIKISHWCRPPDNHSMSNLVKLPTVTHLSISLIIIFT